MAFKEGSIYDGWWKNGVFNGKGRLYMTDGSRCEWDFLNGRTHGLGTMYDLEGKIVYAGEWPGNKEQVVGLTNIASAKEEAHSQELVVGVPTKEEAASQELIVDALVKEDEQHQ
jgi:hypothetical protein